jgi:microcystin-dependent protein
MDAYLGEIRLLPYAAGTAPFGWVPCDGRQLSKFEFGMLFELIGETYGPATATTFPVPDLRGRVPVSQGPSTLLGKAGGEERHVLTSAELPLHTHVAQAAGVPGDDPSPANRAWGVESAGLGYAATGNALMNAAAIAPAGAGQAHENMPPFLVLNFCICVEGVPPPQG